MTTDGPPAAGETAMTGMAVMILGVMLVLLLLGFPMMVPLAAAALAVLVVFFPGDVTPAIMIQQWIGGITPASLIAVPMFILAADIMTRGQAARRLLDAVAAFVGHVRGGLPMTTAVSCALFGAMSGSTQATVVAIGGPLRPRLLEAGYSESFATALIINASDIALLIPPSIGMIVYGVVSGTSIGELFIAGIGPGLLILLLFSAYCWLAIGGMANARAAGHLAGAVAGPAAGAAAARLPGGRHGRHLFRHLQPHRGGRRLRASTRWCSRSFVYREMPLDALPQIALSTGLVTAVVFVLVGVGAGLLLGDLLRPDPAGAAVGDARAHRRERLLADHDLDLGRLFRGLHVRRSDRGDPDPGADLPSDRRRSRHRSGAWSAWW